MVLKVVELGVIAMLEKTIHDEISIRTKALDDKQRRALYSSILSAMKDSKKGSIAELTCSILTRSNRIEENDCKRIADFVNLGVNQFGKLFIWRLYETLCSDETASRLGQYFTGRSLADFALSGLDFVPQRILDPMAGHGAFLIAALEKFPDAALTGIDIDSLPLETANLILGDRAELNAEDVFEWAQRNIAKKSFHFDAIIGNPAYVSYQNLQTIGKFRDLRKSYREYIFNVLRDIAKEKGVELELSKLFKNWSGYSDLAVYAMILSWLILDDGGQIAFVTTNHWLERGYGQPIKQFLTTNGTMKAVVSQRGGSWFPNAQIPTNIFIYKKGNPSEKQKKSGIPFAEIFGEDAGNTVCFKEPKNFWRWLQSVEKPFKNDSVEVSFKRWEIRDKLSLKMFDDEYAFDNIEVPDNLKKHKLSSFESNGWHVHQGLRTGCNEIFYVSKTSSTRNKYLATFTREGKKISKYFDLPSSIVVPTIQKVTSDDPLSLTLNNTHTYLLHFENTVLPEDLERICSKYPSNWKKQWEIEKYREMPHQLAEHIRECQAIPYEGKGLKREPISKLSAVKTNVYSPLLGAKEIPAPPRFWYQIRVQPRHFGRIIIPRVSGGVLRSYLIDERNKVITDANFVTLVPDKEKINAKYLWVWLNSNTFRLMAEINGIAMGGGALKIETTIVEKLPIPVQLLKRESSELDRIADTLERRFSEKDLIEKGEEIDSMLFSRFDAKQVRKILEEYSDFRKKIAPHNV